MNSEQTRSLPEQDHFIVAIGASAGGLEAIHEFFDNLPSNGNFAFVIIQHLSPDYKSLLVELIAKHTKLKVLEANHDDVVTSGNVYVIPNNKLLTISEGRLQLNAKNLEKAPNTAIDTFLRSLAEDQGSKAIAVILSGTGTDGTRGIGSIQNEGGIVFVQDPATAKFDGMPNSAIASGFADYILAPELMPEEMFNYAKERPVRLFSDDRPNETMLPEVLKLVDKHCNYDFYNYKTPTILRRISRRMTNLGYTKFTEYLDFLKESGEECRSLGKEFLIGVTKFFRDKAAFDIIRDQVIPQILSKKKDEDVLKVWVTACSTGEEAYSLAMLIDDLLSKSEKNIDLKIFATDLDIDAIESASKGMYPAQSLAELDKEFIKRYFVKQGSNYVVTPELRKKIVFAKHNVLKDPPFIKNDLATCRNMLIYMNAVLQRKVLSTLQFSLNTGGYLFLGPSEIPSSVREMFIELDGKWKIYQKTTNDNRYNPDRFPTPQAYRPNRDGKASAQQEPALHQDFKSVLIGEYGFAAVYIDRNLEIKDAVGDFKKYLSLPDNIGSLQLLRMVDHDLSIALNTAIRKATKERQKVSLNHVRIKTGDKEKSVNIMVTPSEREDYLMVVFGEGYEVAQTRNPIEFSAHEHGDAVQYISELEDELKETRMNLQMAVESLETANEELQSSNEELLSANEELQSSNEELQSLNEELHTLNTEHQLRIKELIELNDDLNNYFRSTELAQVFVDADLRIRKFNPAAVSMINLIETDIGRPIEHISNNLVNTSLLRDIHESLGKEGTVEKEVQLDNGVTVLMRILPYIRQDKKIDGVVVTFIDISNVKELDNIIKGVFNSSLSAIMAFKAIRNERRQLTDLRFIAANHQADILLHREKQDYIGGSLKESFPELFTKPILNKCLQVVETGHPCRIELELDLTGRKEWYELTANQMQDGVVLTLTNINDKKLAEEKFRENYHELMKAKESYRNLNIQLEEKVHERTQELSLSEERFRLIANATNDAIWDWDLVNNNVWWSESFYKSFGFEKGEATNNAKFWLGHIHEDDIPRINDIIHEAINEGKDWSARYRFRKADGRYASILDRGTVLKDPHGTPYRMVGAMMDVSETEMAEKKIREKNEEIELLFQEFRFVTDFMPQMVWSANPQGGYDFYNKRWYDYTGLDFAKSKENGWTAAVHPDDREKSWHLWEEALRTGKNFEIEYRLKRRDGTYRWFLARAIPLKDDAGKIVKWFGSSTDIQEQKMASDVLEQKVVERTNELIKANMELESSNHELLQFASVASHDLKEPLRKIHMFSNLIKDRFISQMDGAAEYMDRIITSSARMTKLINDLLSFTRLSVSSQFETMDLNRIVDEVTSDLELSIQEKHAIIETADLPEAEIISGQMRQVFQNIISNALKFSKKDERPRIKIDCERVSSLAFDSRISENGDYVKITIQDNGIGFDNQYAEKIFTIFQRLHPREKFEGTGIGLAITKKIIEKHNGIVTASSKENQGARFEFVIPLKQEVPAHMEMSTN